MTSRDAKITAFHTQEIESFAQAGDWLSGEERTAIAQQARKARVNAGQQVECQAGPGDITDLLPTNTKNLVDLVATAPAELTREHLAECRGSGMHDHEYAETVGVVSRLVNVDVFAHACGRAPEPLVAPVDGEPDYPDTHAAQDEGGWLKSIPGGESGGELGMRIYGGAMMPFIYRALSLAPQEVERVIEGGNQQYLELQNFFDFSYSHHAGLNRAQIEALAARVSAYNECFY